jgi:hydrogenase maturation protease
VRVRVIGLGNRDRGDDALGLLAVEAAGPALAGLSDVEVALAASALDVVELLEGVDAAVVVDAVSSRDGSRPPGTLVIAAAGDDGLPATIRSSLSTHGLGVGEAVGIAAAFGRLPRLVFLGLEASAIGNGDGLSPPVADAIPDLAGLIEAEARTLLRGPNAPPGGGREA